MRTRPLDLGLERLRRLPAGGDVWQVAVRPAANWIVPEDDDDNGGVPYRPLLAVCLSLETGRWGLGDVALPGTPHADLAFRAVASLGATPGIDALPAMIETTDPALRDALAEALWDLGIDVRQAASLDAVDRLFAHMREAMGEDDPGLYDSDVTLDRLRSFADASRAFESAAPWNHLGNDDLVHVETRSAPAGMRWFVVMGAAGMRRGLAFFKSRSEFVGFMESPGTPEAFARSAHWSFSFDPPYLLPIADLERWEEHGLPRTADGFIPVLTQLSLRNRDEPADADRLAFAEALLRVLAETTEDEMDEGRWSRTVPVEGGERVLTLALPELLEAESPKRRGKRPTLPPGEMPDRRMMEREMAKIHRLIAEGKNVDEINAFLAAHRGRSLPEQPAANPREEAQELFYAALEAHGRRRIKLAREAVRRFADCADALVLLAEEMPDPGRSMALYRAALEAGERIIGPAAFVEHRGHFWGIQETRPYMRARQGLAGLLWEAGEHEAAFAHWREMLELNPGDNQGVRLVLIPRLLERGGDAEAAELLAAYREDRTGIMVYAAALAAFLRHGKGSESNPLLARAVRANPHAVKYLLDPDNLPEESPRSYRFGSEEEAILIAENMSAAWRATPGGLEWLREHRREAKKLREGKRKGKKRGPPPKTPPKGRS